MRIRIIIAAVAAPLALGGVLLATAGQASAAVTTPVAAVLTASVKQQVNVTTHRTGVYDTTYGQFAGTYTDNTYAGGPVWAHDDMEAIYTAAFDHTDPATGYGVWNVHVAEHGTFTSVADPRDGSKQMIGVGPVDGTIDYQVTSPNPPSGKNLPPQSPFHGPNGDMTTGALLTQLFGGKNVTIAGGDDWSFHYVLPDGSIYTQP